MSILIVDDSKAMRMIVRRALRQAGYGGYEVVDAVRGFHARHPGPITALTGPSLATRLLAAYNAAHPGAS